MKKSLSLLFCILFAFAFAELGNAQNVVKNKRPADKVVSISRIDTCIGGREDNFDLSDGPEPTIVSEDLQARLDGCATTVDYFDDLASNACFGHTMYCPQCTLAATWDSVWTAILEIRMTTRSALFAFTDYLSLEDDRERVWGTHLDSLQIWHTNDEDSSWASGDTSTFRLDLSDLPYEYNGTTNILESLRDGSLDILVHDDTQVDHIKLYVVKLSGVGISENAPRSSFLLHQNHPNPFNPVTTIQFELPVSTPVILNIYDISGQLVRTLLNESCPAGLQRAVWNGKNAKGELVASGIYFYQLRAGSEIQTRKMLLLK